MDCCWIKFRQRGQSIACAYVIIVVADAVARWLNRCNASCCLRRSDERCYHHIIIRCRCVAAALHKFITTVTTHATITVAIEVQSLETGRVVFEAGRLQVLVQVRLEGECFVTSRALEVLVDRVRLHVRSQVAPVRKRFAAVGASVRLLAGVRSQVTLQQPRSREELSTHTAAVRQLMSEDVHRQSGHRNISFAACVTLLRRLRVETAMSLLVT